MNRRLLLGTFLLVLAFAEKRKIDKDDRDGESCGSDAVPYLIEIDQNGKPELYCDTPICLEPPVDFRRAKRDSTDKPTAYPECNHELLETVCVGEKEWTSGLKEINNGTHRTLKTECCTYSGLGGAKELKTVLLEAGDRFQGGPVRIHGRERAFDLVKEVRKTVNSDNRVQYVISVYRMPCSANGDDFTPYSRAAHQRTRKQRLERRGAMLYDDFDYGSRGGRKYLDDYDLPPRVLRRMQRRRMMRRRPILEDYYDYDADYSMPMRPVQHRKKGGARQLARGVALGMDDRLWPVNYEGGASESVQPLPEVTVTNEGMQQQAMPMPPPGQDSGMQSLQTLNALPSAEMARGGADYAPGSYAMARGEAYPQPPLNKEPIDTYVRPRVFDSQPQPVQQIQYQAQPQPQQTYNYAPSYPAYQSGTGLNGIFDQMQCFSGDLMVETSEGPRAMKDLKTGDEVLSIEENMISFSPIIMFLHRDEELLAEFNVITTENGQSVKLTNEHLIYVSDCEAESPLQLVRAREVTVDHCLMSVRSPVRTLTIGRVTSVTKVHEAGIYAPLTTTGDIIVNDVLSSCHSNLAVKTLQQSFFSLYRTFSRSLSFVLPSSLLNEEADVHLPFGLAYLTSAIDLFVPTKAALV